MDQATERTEQATDHELLSIAAFFSGYFDINHHGEPATCADIDGAIEAYKAARDAGDLESAA